MSPSAKHPRVSIIINTYNHEKFIAQAIGSALQQDFPIADMEIIVVDDGSTDKTPEIIKTFLPHIHYIRKPNGGQVSAFHSGIASARGEIVAFLDGDDWWTTEKIRKVVDAFDRYSGIAAVGHGFFEVDENGAVRRVMRPEREYQLDFGTCDSARFAANLRVFGGTSRMAMRRSAVDRALPVPLKMPFFDNFLFTQAIALSGAVLLAQPLCYYRLHARNLYASAKIDQDNLRRRYVLQASLVENLPARLASLGVSDEIISAALECDRLDAARLRLLVDGGKPWETFQVERSEFRIGYQNPSLSYTLFKYLALFITLIMPPRSFYSLKKWYAEHDLKRIRSWIAGANARVPDGVRRVEKQS